jgi:hypothetical protein
MPQIEITTAMSVEDYGEGKILIEEYTAALGVDLLLSKFRGRNGELVENLRASSRMLAPRPNQRRIGRLRGHPKARRRCL